MQYLPLFPLCPAGTVDRLLQYADVSSPSLNLTEALAEAEGILSQLQGRNLWAAEDRAGRELAEAVGLRQRVEGLALNGTGSSETLDRVEELRERFEELLQMVEGDVRRNVSEVRVSPH